MNNNCFLCLCNVNGVERCLSSDSKQLSIILCQILNVPHLRINTKKLESISYCHPCIQRIINLNDLLENLKNMEKKVFKEKYLIGLQLEENYQNYSDSDNKFLNLSDQFRIELVTEMRFNSIKSKLVQIAKFRIVKNTTIYKDLEDKTVEVHDSKLSTPEELNCGVSQDVFYISGQQEISENLSTLKPDLCQIMDSKDISIKSQFNNVELPEISYEYDFHDIKLETIKGEPDIPPTDVRDPFEGILPESNFHIQNNEVPPPVSHSVQDENLSIFIQEAPIIDQYNLQHQILQMSEDPSTQNNFICGICEASFDDYNQFDEHCHTHNGMKPFKCPFCPKKFSFEYFLKRHICIHTGEDPYKCTICEKTFTKSYNLKQHELRHKSMKLYECGYCERTFCTSNEKKKHERTHTGEKPFKCNHCERTFANQYNKRDHERRHTGEKPYKCQCCEKKFFTKSNLNIHKPGNCLKKKNSVHSKSYSNTKNKTNGTESKSKS